MIITTTTSLSFINLSGDEVNYNLSRNSCMKVDIHEGYTLHKSHVCK